MTRRVVVTPIPGGPILVRGADSVLGADNREHDATRPVVAVCACGKSSRSPWCDGTHKLGRKAKT